MCQLFNILKCIVIIVLAQNIVQGFSFVKIRGVSEQDILPRLLNIIGDSNGEIRHGRNQGRYGLNNIATRVKIFRKKMGNSIAQPDGYHDRMFVKRPHGYRSNPEIYKKYKPLSKVHKKKRVNDIESKYRNKYNKENPKLIFITKPYSNNILTKNKNKIQKLKKHKAKVINNMALKQNNIDDGAKLQPLSLQIPIELMHKINKNVDPVVKNLQRKPSSKPTKKEARNLKKYNDFLYVLDNIGVANYLRTKYDKSGEEHDPLAPGKSPALLEEDETTEKPKKWLPYYPFWNYWTYDKTLYQDNCKGKLINFGGICIGPS